MSLSSPIYVLKRKAKLLVREKDIPLHKALEHLAQNEGFKSWSLLMKHNAGKTHVLTNVGKQHPYSDTDRTMLIQMANRKFENIIERIEPLYPEETRELWNAERYVDAFLSDNNLPTDERDYAEHILIDVEMPRYVIGLAVQVDKKHQAA